MKRTTLGITLVLASLIFSLFLVSSVSATDSWKRDKAPRCVYPLVTKQALVFANICDPEASFSVRIKDILRRDR